MKDNIQKRSKELFGSRSFDFFETDFDRIFVIVVFSGTKATVES